MSIYFHLTKEGVNPSERAVTRGRGWEGRREGSREPLTPTKVQGSTTTWELYAVNPAQHEFGVSDLATIDNGAGISREVERSSILLNRFSICH